MKRTLAAIALIAVVAAGCGSNASSGTGSGSAGHEKLSKRAQGVKFAECMRGNGVPDFPDPDAKGEFEYGVSVTPAVFQRAVNACKDLQPPGSLSSKRTAKQQSEALKFAQCVRANGVKDFPDPIQGEPLINTYRIPSSNKPGGMTILNTAIKKCRALLARAAAGQ